MTLHGPVPHKGHPQEITQSTKAMSSCLLSPGPTPPVNAGALASFLPWIHKCFQRPLSTFMAFPWSLSENYLSSWLVSSLTAMHGLPSGIFHPPSSTEHRSQAVAPLRRCRWQLGVLKSSSSSPREAHAVTTQPVLCSAAHPHRPPPSPANVVDRHRPFLFFSPHELEMLLREVNERESPK